ncbi:hypothetical protein HJC23_010228 [Cyclotella cryptica]|uniref:Mitochondrial inner membrane protease subunit n=1 Tax=Cyclotella cryptica TaxID=29204 RepID=A0ABD3Q2B6_9STRA
MKSDKIVIETLRKLRLLPQFSHLHPIVKSPPTTTAQRQLQQLNEDAIRALRQRIPLYLVSLFGFVSATAIVGTVTHYNDKYYPYYPFPFAIDIGDGPSMLPTMIPCVELYWRDCWSDRFFWINWRHFKEVSMRLFADDASLKSTMGVSSYKRPWQRGDIVTIFNPYSKTIICKRIIGVEGDTIQVFGEYSQAYHDFEENECCGVPYDERYPMPFCRKVAFEQGMRDEGDGPLYETCITVPQNHVWVEGDNPLYSTDSRHFGPLPISSLRGRVTLRLWPIRRHHVSNTSDKEAIADEEVRDWCALSSKRPFPFMHADQMLRNGKYGVREVK